MNRNRWSTNKYQWTKANQRFLIGIICMFIYHPEALDKCSLWVGTFSTLYFFYCNKTKNSYLIFFISMYIAYFWSCTQISKHFNSTPYNDIPLRLLLVHVHVTIVAWFQQVLRQVVDFPERNWRWFGRGYILWNLFSYKFLVVIVFFSMYL